MKETLIPVSSTIHLDSVYSLVEVKAHVHAIQLLGIVTVRERWFLSAMRAKALQLCMSRTDKVIPGEGLTCFFGRFIMEIAKGKTVP